MSDQLLWLILIDRVGIMGYLVAICYNGRTKKGERITDGEFERAREKVESEKERMREREREIE